MTSQWFSICLLFLLLSQVTVNVSRQRHADVRQENVPCRNPDQEAACHCAEVIPCDKSWLQEVTRGFSMFPGGGWVHILVYLFFRKKNTGLKADNACLTYWTLPWTHKDKEKKRFRQFHVFFQSRPDSHLYSQIHTVYTVWIYIYVYIYIWKILKIVTLLTVKMNLESSWVSVLLLSACFFKCLQLIEHL